MYSLKQLLDIGIISKRLKQVLSLLGCSTFEDMVGLSYEPIKVDYIEKSYHLKDELLKAIADIQELEDILPEMAASVKTSRPLQRVQPSDTKKKKFKVGDFTEELLLKSDVPIKQEELLQQIKRYLPDTYIESIRANLNGDPQKRFVFFLDGYVGLREKVYDSRYRLFSIENKKVQYAERRIMEFLNFIESKHRSPQPHGLEEEESLYRWYLDFAKDTTKELAELRATFLEYIEEYDEWMFTPQEYSYKRNCDQMKWYVDTNLELPTSDDEPELSSWFNSQLGNYKKYKDKRMRMFAGLLEYLEDYGMHFYDAKSAKGRAAIKENASREVPKESKEAALEKYIRLFEIISRREDERYAVHKALLIIAIGNLIQKGNISNINIRLDDELLTEFADVCIDNVGTASSYNIALPYYYMSEEPFWNLIPKETVARDEAVEPELTFDYIERTFSCSVMDYDLFEVLANAAEFDVIKSFLTTTIIKNENSLSDKRQEDSNEQLDEENEVDGDIDEDSEVEIDEEEYVSEDDGKLREYLTDYDLAVDDDALADSEADIKNITTEIEAQHYFRDSDEDEIQIERVYNGLWRLKLYRTFSRANDVENANALESYLVNIGRIPIISIDEEKELFRKYEGGDYAAFEKLVNANLRFVVSVAKQYRGCGVSFEELIQEANIGLIKAIERYDYRRGAKLLSFAVSYIRWHLMSTLPELQYLVRIPVNKASVLTDVRKKFELFEQQFHMPPTIYDLGLDDEMIPREAESLVAMAMLDKEEMIESLDEETVPAGDSHYYTERKIDLESLNFELHELLNFFPKRVQNIMLKYYAIDGGEGETLDSIGEQMGMTRERVRQIKEKCLKGLRLLFIKKYHIRGLDEKEQEFVDTLLKQTPREDKVKRLKTHTNKQESSTDFSAIIKKLLSQEGLTKEQIANKEQDFNSVNRTYDTTSSDRTSKERARTLSPKSSLRPVSKASIKSAIPDRKKTFEERVLQIVRTHSGIKAKDIADILRTSRSKVNSTLYKLQNRHKCSIDSNYLWH